MQNSLGVYSMLSEVSIFSNGGEFKIIVFGLYPNLFKYHSEIELLTVMRWSILLQNIFSKVYVITENKLD